MMYDVDAYLQRASKADRKHMVYSKQHLYKDLVRVRRGVCVYV